IFVSSVPSVTASKDARFPEPSVSVSSLKLPTHAIDVEKHKTVSPSALWRVPDLPGLRASPQLTHSNHRNHTSRRPIALDRPVFLHSGTRIAPCATPRADA